MDYKIILASASPRRKQILEKLNIPFTIEPADIDESVIEEETPCHYVERLAIEKAQKISTLYPEAFVIGSDLTCDLDGVSIGKAKDAAMAREMLKNFSGREHYGRCGWAVVKGSCVLASGVATTFVSFKDLDEEQINKYLDSKQWLGLAGAYGVQNDGAKFIKLFKGSYYDILGLPIYHVASALMSFGVGITRGDIENIRRTDSLITIQNKHISTSRLGFRL